MAGEEETQRQARTGRGGVRAWTGRKRTGADGGFDDGRRGGVLPLQTQPGPAVLVLLRSLCRRANGELRLCGHVLDVGKRQGQQEGRPKRGVLSGTVESQRILTIGVRFGWRSSARFDSESASRRH